MAKNESDDFVEDESGFSVEAEVVEPEPAPEPAAPAGPGPVFTRGEDGRLVDISGE